MKRAANVRHVVTQELSQGLGMQRIGRLLHKNIGQF